MTDGLIPPRAQFPAGFVFGAATAAYQIEGSGAGGAGPSHWDTFAATPGNVRGGEDGRLACDHLHRWEADLDMVRALNADAYRFSTSWARVMPDGVNVNPEGLDFYDRLVDGMLARGLQPWHTLYHWDLPAALADRGGWVNRDTCQRFADYVAVISGRLGDRVAATATINEPWCVAWLSHFIGAHAPGLRDIRAAARAMHHILLAHGLGMQVLRGLGRRNAGIVLNFTDMLPASDSDADRAAAALEDGIFNRWFVDALAGDGYPADVLAGLGPHMPVGWQDDMALIAGPVDWLGVNYYTRMNVAHDPARRWPSTAMVAGHLPQTQMGWEIWPEGLTRLLTWAAGRLPGVPIHVTENGMAWPDEVRDGAVHDPDRTDYLARHLGAVQAAIAQGADVRGYFYWSLMDNYEWSEGYAKRFGLVHVDYATLARTPKESYHAFARALARND
jgi:beta-glucosidase